MATISLSDFQSFINQQIKLQEKMAEYLCKIEAQIEVFLQSEDFHCLKESTLHNYFWGVAGILTHAIKTNQASLNGLLSQQTAQRKWMSSGLDFT